MNWLLIIVTAHLLSAVVFTVDKFIFSKTALRPVAGAFYAGLLGALALFLAPFGFFLPGLSVLAAALLSGAFYIFAGVFFLKAIRVGEVSRIAPFVGSVIPIFSFGLSYSFLGERLTNRQLSAFCLLVIGGFIMLWAKEHSFGILKSLRDKHVFKLSVISAVLFAVSFVLAKFVFDLGPFINGFIWMRLGGFLGACFLLILPQVRRKIFMFRERMPRKKTIALFTFNKTLSAGAFALQSYAIYLGSVVLVNALQGVQYVFLLAIALLFSWKFPQILDEKRGAALVAQKIIAILLIGLGLGLLI